MNAFLSMTDILRSHVEPYVRLAWFLHEAIEREHRLNLAAVSGTPGALVQAWARMVPVPVAPVAQPRERRSNRRRGQPAPHGRQPA